MKEEHKIPKQFLLDGEVIENILRRAVRHALLEHKRAGNTIAVWKDGRIVLIPAGEIHVEAGADNEYILSTKQYEHG